MKIAKLAAESLGTLSAVSPSLVMVAAATLTIAALAALGWALVRRAEPPLAFAVGMGAYVLLQTVLGVAGLDLRLGIALAALAAAASAWRLGPVAAKGWGRPVLLVLVLLLPLLLLLSDRRGSEWDEFSHWLHAFRYLATTHRLPGGPDAPAIASCCAAYPYAWPLVGAAAMALTGFSEAVPALLNILVLALFGLMLGHLAAEAAGVRRPGAGLWAWAVLFATLLSPAFVHKLAFSAYADVITAYLVAMLVIAGERLCAARRDDRETAPLQWGLAFGLIGGTVLAVKPGNAALFACTLGAALVMTLRGSGLRGLLRREWLPAIVLPLLFAALWRWHVGQYLSGQEMGLRPFDSWNIPLIPAIVRAMIDVASQKGGHFGLGIVVTGLGLVGLVRDRNRFDRLCAVAGMLFVGYNLFLLTTYVAVFGAEDGLKVMSFWRYNTHVGFAITLPAAMVAGHLLGRFAGRRWMTALGGIGIVLALAGPLAAARLVRFDLDPMKTHYRETLRQLPGLVPAGALIGIMDANGSGLSQVMAIYEWNDRSRFGGVFSAFDNRDPKAWLDSVKADWVIVLSGQERVGLDSGRGALLLHREDGAWRIREGFPYPGGKLPGQWP